MLKLLSTTFLFFISSILLCQIGEVNNHPVKGKIRSVHEKIYSVPKSDGITSSEHLLSDAVNYYNELGFIYRTDNFKNDTLFSYVIYTLIDDSVLTQSIEYNSNGTVFLKIKYYTDDHLYITRAVYNRDQQKTYDDERKSIDVEFEKYFNNLFVVIEYQNDYKGYVLESKYIKMNGGNYCRFTHKYDYKYNRVETKYYNDKNKLSWRKKMTYDKDGYLAETKLFQSNRLARSSSFKYSNKINGFWTEKIEERQLYDNFFAYDLNDNTIVTTRYIEFYQ